MSRLMLVLAVVTWACSNVRPVRAQEPEATTHEDRSPPSARGDHPLAMTKGVVCRSIDGFERFERLPKASLTQDEKLQIYYRPLHYQVVQEGEKYRVHLTQDGQIRRQGQKAVLRRKLKILEYEPESTDPPGEIFLRNSVPLKGLPPGNYEYDIILRDENSPGTPVVQSVKFRIIPAELPKARTGKGSEPE